MIVLITIGAIIAIPIPFSPVPIVLQNAFIVLTGILLAPQWALGTVILYLAIGAVGLPVFAGATGGVARLVGPSAGYLWCYPFAAAVTSLILRAGFRSGAEVVPQIGTVRMASAISAGFLLPYVGGVAWLSRVVGLSIAGTLPIGFFPFLPLDIVKLIAVFFVVRAVPDSVWKSLS